jgi:hypothetical protein
MSITKLEEWAADVVGESDINGPKVETDSTYLARVPNGMTAERLPYPTLNRILNDIHTKINESLSKGPKGWNPSATIDTVLTGIHSPSDAGTFGYDSHNELDSGDASDEFVDLALAVIDGSRKIICLDWTTPQNVEIFDVDAMVYDGQQSVSALSLPMDAGNESWRPSAIVCDADSAYILWQDVGASSAYHYDSYVQAYSLSDWTVKVGWPATGLFLYNHGDTQNAGNMIFATSGLLAIFDQEINISAATDRAVIFVDITNGTEQSHGAGDVDDSYPTAICSNGEYVFLSTGTRIGSINISSPATGCGGTGWPRSVPGGDGIGCLGNVVVGLSSNVIYLLHTSNANIATITPIDDTIVKNFENVAVDGINFWVRGEKTVDGTDRDCFVYRLNLHGLMQKNSTTPVTAADEIFECFAISLDDGGYSSRMIYDGDGIVGIMNFNGDGRIWKLPKVVLR